MNPLRGIQGIIFDFDGTLAVLNIDFKAMKEQVFNLINHFGIDESVIQEKYLLEVIEEVYLILWKRNPTEALSFYQKSHHILQEVELRAAGEGRLLPGVEGTLNALRKMRMKVGIITRNCEEAVRKVFPNIDDYCDAFISRDSVKKVKPHPDHLTAILEALHLANGEAMMVGDHLIDIQAGKIMGMRTIGVLTGRITEKEFEQAGADIVLKDVSGLSALFE